MLKCDKKRTVKVPVYSLDSGKLASALTTAFSRKASDTLAVLFEKFVQLMRLPEHVGLLLCCFFLISVQVDAHFRAPTAAITQALADNVKATRDNEAAQARAQSLRDQAEEGQKDVKSIREQVNNDNPEQPIPTSSTAANESVAQPSSRLDQVLKAQAASAGSHDEL